MKRQVTIAVSIAVLLALVTWGRIALLDSLGLGVTARGDRWIIGVTAAAFICAATAWRLGGWIAAISAALLILGSRAALVVATEHGDETLMLIFIAEAIMLLVSRRWLLAAMILAAVLVMSPVVRNPGVVFYAGNNPLSTGCGGVPPRVDVEPVKKALAHARLYPRHALAILGWKAILTVHHYDVHDTVPTRWRSDALARFPAIPFGVAVVLSAIALAMSARRRELLPIALLALAIGVLIALFMVNARQRNALLAPLAVLGGVGAAEIVALARARNERSLIALGALLVVTPILGIEGAPMREDEYVWRSTFRAAEALEQAKAARASGDPARAARNATAASILDTANPPVVAEVTLRSGALIAAEHEETPPRLFDIAIALEKASAWREADAILQSIAGYKPRRGNRAVSSVAYYRAVAALHLGRPDFRELLDAAEREAPGDPYVLALRASAPGRAEGAHHSAARKLDALYDPITRDLALRHALRTRNGRSGSSGAGR